MLLVALDNGPGSEMDDLRPSSVEPQPSLAWNIDAAQNKNDVTSGASAGNSLDLNGMANT